MIDLNAVLTFSEAAEKWGFRDGNTLRKALERKRFKEHEVRKSGSVWLTTYEAMLRVFGEPQHIHYSIYYTDIVKLATYCIQGRFDFMDVTHSIYEKACLELNKGNKVAIVKSKEHPHMIARIITSVEELEAWLRYYGNRITGNDTSYNKNCKK